MACLPASSIAGGLTRELACCGCAVVTAPPGAGKSTVLPITVMMGLETRGRVIVLEPRRVAACQIAERMASLLGERCGDTVGYRVRFENRIGPSTRIEVVTEGILERMLVDDPALDGVSAVIFDEFHERSIHSDVSLALCRETRKILRPDLRLVIMSATIDTDTICASLSAPLVRCEGRMFPVTTIHAREDCDVRDIAQTAARAVSVAHREHSGDILVFLPGEGEILRCAELLAGALGDTKVFPLYGNLPFEAQKQAIMPDANGGRRVVLATSIAETSLTIEGVRIVVDSGFCRKAVFNPQTSLSGMETVRISLDMADQRRGRAGRTAPGVCYRLWTEATEKRMQPCRVSEILESDLSDALLELSAFGCPDVYSLDWISLPPKERVLSARSCLESIGAIDAESRITARGKRIASMPCHPRIASMLLSAGSDSSLSLAADVAAIMEDRDPMPQLRDDVSLGTRVDELRRVRSGNARSRGWDRIIRASSQYRRMMKAREDNTLADRYALGALVASAWPEKVAKSKEEGCGRFLLASGSPVSMGGSDPMSAQGWIAVALMNSRPGEDGRIFLASELDPADVPDLVRERDVVAWDDRAGRAVARHERNIGCLSVASKPIHDAPRELLMNAVCEAVRRSGESLLEFSDAVLGLQRRIAAVASWRPELELPDVGTKAVLSAASDWLPLYLGKSLTADELRRIDLCAVIWGMLSYEQQQSVERLAPSHIEVPTGSRIRVEYRLGAEAPVLRVRLQECFGMQQTPLVDGGRRPVLMELLSPGFKPVQLTSDLASFWKGTYFEVRKELRSRYPRHSWPEDPLSADPVRGVRKNAK